MTSTAFGRLCEQRKSTYTDRPADVSQIGVAFDMASYMAQRRNVFALSSVGDSCQQVSMY